MIIEGAVPETRWRLTGVAVFAVAAFLLLSMGGAILAAPLTVPLLLLAWRRHPTTAFRAVDMVLTGLTVAEVVWALTYLQLEEMQPWVWLLPLLGGAIDAVSFIAATIPGRCDRVIA